jgi:hypothetical protein
MPALIQRLESRLLLTAVNLSGASQFSGSASGTPHSSLPGAQVVTPTAGPDSVGQLTGFSASAASTSQISLTWNSVSGATSYNIYRGTSSNGENSTPIASGIAGTRFTDVGLLLHRRRRRFLGTRRPVRRGERYPSVVRYGCL